MTTEVKIERMRLVDVETESVLARLYTLLLGHKHDHAREGPLRRLQDATPGAEEYFADTGGTVLQPLPLAVVDELMNLAESEVREALHLGYLVGSARVLVANSSLSPDQRAWIIIETMGLQEMAEANLAHAYVPTKKATAMLLEAVA